MTTRCLAVVFMVVGPLSSATRSQEKAERPSPPQPLRRIEKHDDWTWAVALSPDEWRLLTCSGRSVHRQAIAHDLRQDWRDARSHFHRRRLAPDRRLRRRHDLGGDDARAFPGRAAPPASQQSAAKAAIRWFPAHLAPKSDANFTSSANRRQRTCLCERVCS